MESYLLVLTRHSLLKIIHPTLTEDKDLWHINENIDGLRAMLFLTEGRKGQRKH